MKCAQGLAALGLPHPTLQHNLVKLCTGLEPVSNNKSHVDAGPSPAPGSPQRLPRLEVRSSPGKGLGLFAVAQIPAYSRLLEDNALLSLADGEDLPQLWQKYCALPPELKLDFDNLCLSSDLLEKEERMVEKLEQRGYTTDARKMARVNSQWQANAFKTGVANIGSPGSHQWSYSLFATVARINHSCTPNACAHYRPSGVEMVYAIRDIEPGDEVQIAYFDMTMGLADRQGRAKAWGFECSCPACLDEGVDIAYAQRLSHLHRQLSLNSTSYTPDVAIDAVQTAIAIAHSPQYPWLVIALPKLYLTLFNLEIQRNGSTNKLRDTLEKVLEWEEKITGRDSPTCVQRRSRLRDFESGDV